MEFKTKLDKNKLVQAHGNLINAHCINCRKIYDINEFGIHIQNQTIMKCSESRCSNKINYVKPTIVFFGESMEKSFFDNLELIETCDLCIVMGTSLKVAPFSNLVYDVPKSSPIIVINRDCDENLSHQNNCIFLEGDIDTTI